MLAGSSIIYGPGMLESGMTFDPAQLVIDDEIVAMTRFLKRGVAVNDATTAIEEIIAVGPAGNFLERDSTLRGFRVAHVAASHRPQGARGLGGRRARPTSTRRPGRGRGGILAEHEVEPLDGDVAQRGARDRGAGRRAVRAGGGHDPDRITMKRRRSRVIHGMRAGCATRGPTLNLFSEADLEDLHMATLDVLERLACSSRPTTPSTSSPTAAAGSIARPTSSRSRRSRRQSAESRRGRHSCWQAGIPKKDVIIAQGRVTVCPFTEGVMVNDIDTGKNRHSTLQDLKDNLRVGDYLKNYDFNTVSVTARDCPPETAELHHVEAALANNTKAFMVSITSTKMAEAAFEIGAVVAGGEDKLRERRCSPTATARSVPCTSRPSAQRSRSRARGSVSLPAASPWTWRERTLPSRSLGTLIVQNAELLSCLVLNQLVSPRSGVLLRYFHGQLRHARARPPSGTAELALLQAGTAGMARYYNLPSWTAGY